MRLELQMGVVRREVGGGRNREGLMYWAQLPARRLRPTETMRRGSAQYREAMARGQPWIAAPAAQHHVCRSLCLHKLHLPYREAAPKVLATTSRFIPRSAGVVPTSRWLVMPPHAI